jgi:hypothetical protein
VAREGSYLSQIFDKRLGGQQEYAENSADPGGFSIATHRLKAMR